MAALPATAEIHLGNRDIDSFMTMLPATATRARAGGDAAPAAAAAAAATAAAAADGATCDDVLCWDFASALVMLDGCAVLGLRRTRTTGSDPHFSLSRPSCIFCGPRPCT